MKTLTVTALLVSILSLGTPLFLGGLLSGLSGILVICCYKKPNYYALAAAVINIINIVILSSQKVSSDLDLVTLLGPFIYFFAFVVFIQIIAVFLYVKYEGKRSKTLKLN